MENHEEAGYCKLPCLFHARRIYGFSSPDIATPLRSDRKVELVSSEAIEKG